MAKRPTSSTNPPVEAILVECAIATGRSLGNKTVSLGAAELWSATYKKSIADALRNGGIWSEDRKPVIVMARKLGREARRLAGTSTTISKANAKKAAATISRDPTCGAGGGRYCPVGVGV